MKKFLLSILALVAVVFLFPPAVAVAQEAPVPFDAETAARIAEPWVVSIAKDHPWIATVLLVMAALRMVFKPIMSLALSRRGPASSSPETSSWYRAIAWILDFGASIKLPPPGSRSTTVSNDAGGVSVKYFGRRPDVDYAGSAFPGVLIWGAFAVGFAFMLTGCASFSTHQIDKRKEPNGSETEVATRVTARTLFTSKSSLANFKASQTEKQQGAAVGSLTQEASGTNAVRAIEALERIARGSIRP